MNKTKKNKILNHIALIPSITIILTTVKQRFVNDCSQFCIVLNYLEEIGPKFTLQWQMHNSVIKT